MSRDYGRRARPGSCVYRARRGVNSLHWDFVFAASRGGIKGRHQGVASIGGINSAGAIKGRRQGVASTRFGHQGAAPRGGINSRRQLVDMRLQVVASTRARASKCGINSRGAASTPSGEPKVCHQGAWAATKGYNQDAFVRAGAGSGARGPAGGLAGRRAKGPAPRASIPATASPLKGTSEPCHPRPRQHL